MRIHSPDRMPKLAQTWRSTPRKLTPKMDLYIPAFGGFRRYRDLFNQSLAMAIEGDRVFYQRRLPHWQPPERDIFLTWRIFGSPPPLRLTGRPNVDFLNHDRVCDRARTGALWLQVPDVAASVLATLQYAEDNLNYFELHSWVIMPNHLHLLLSPTISIQRITQCMKGYSARKINRMLGREGQPFWQQESYDHWVRSQGEFRRIKRYIERNPVSAGLVENPQQWRWSSAHPAKPEPGTDE